MIKELKRTGTKDEELGKFEKYVHEFAQPIISSQVIDGLLLTGIKITNAQTTTVDHGLDRELLGWFPVRKRGAGDVWDLQDTNLFKTKTLLLTGSADVTIDIWVF